MKKILENLLHINHIDSVRKRLYFRSEIDFEKAEQDGLKAYFKLCKITGYQPKYVK